MRRGRPRHDDVLTPREWQVLDLLREDLTNEQIGERLGISHDTAKFHVSEILTKLGVSSRREAATWHGRPKVAFGLGTLAAFLHKAGSVSPLKLAGASAIVVAGVALVLLAVGVLLGSDGGSLGKIAFVRDGNIWVQDLPNGTPYQLTDKGDSSRPAWSPSGDWLLYTRTGSGSPGRPDLWVVKTDGSQERVIEGAGFSAYWLPDADDRLVHYTDDDETVVEDPDGGNRVVLSAPFTDANGEKVVRFVYPGLPVPGRILYVEAHYPAGDEHRAAPSGPLMRGFGVSNADGSDARLLLSSDAEATVRDLFFAWSPDGSRLIFFTYDEEAGELIQDGVPLSTIPIDGGAKTDLALTVFPTLRTSQNDAGIALVTGEQHETWTNKRIAVLSPDASNYDYLTGPDVAAISPAWSPDGTQIAYLAAPDLGPDRRDEALALRRLWASDADGSSQRQLTTGEGFRDDAPMWSADGSSILFARMSLDDPCFGGSYDLMRYGLDDGSIEVVASDLPLYGAWFDVEVGEIPECDSGVDNLTTDTNGALNLSTVLSWWEPEAD
jgi:DNA-binding CsgD family transcriptional regulator